MLCGAPLRQQVPHARRTRQQPIPPRGRCWRVPIRASLARELLLLEWRISNTPIKLFRRRFVMPHEDLRACIDACHACAVACNHCAASCLRERNVDEMRKCIELDIDCAQICAFAAAAMSRASEHSKEICQLCARICEECGAECAKHAAQHCLDCAKACERCSQACNSMQ